MGRREFYAIVDETHRQIEARNTSKPGSWDGYESDPWYQQARVKSGRAPN